MPPLDLWGHCPDCQRWYQIDTRRPDDVRWECPSCAVPPVRIVDLSHRPAGRSASDAVLETAGRRPPPETWHS